MSPVPNDLEGFFFASLSGKNTIVLVAIKKHMCCFFFSSSFLMVSSREPADVCGEWCWHFSLERVSDALYSCTQDELSLFRRACGGGENQRV